METPAIELSRIRTVVALIRRGEQLLLVEAKGPDDPAPVWMLPGGQVEEGEALLDALRRELAEATGLQIVGEPELAFEVEGRRPVSGPDVCVRGQRRSPAQ